MDEKDLLQQIVLVLQKKYNGLNEIWNVTKQLQDALNYNDIVTIRMLIRMRQEELIKVGHIDEEWKELMDQLTEEQKAALENGDILHFPAESRGLTEKLVDLRGKNKRLLEKLIEQDEKVNRKVTGEKSFYNK